MPATDVLAPAFFALCPCRAGIVYVTGQREDRDSPIIRNYNTRAKRDVLILDCKVHIL
jgi:hypothetical protein